VYSTMSISLISVQWYDESALVIIIINVYTVYKHLALFEIGHIPMAIGTLQKSSGHFVHHNMV